MKNLIICFALVFTASKGTSQGLVDAGFENLLTGQNTSTAWVSSMAGFYLGTVNSPTCNGTYPAFVATNSTAVVMSTPIMDAVCGNILSSPFAGNKVMRLNKSQFTNRTRLRQTFNVTNAAFIYRYAYKAVLEGTGQVPCDAGNLFFNFYDCNNNPIAALSKTISTVLSNAYNPDAALWSYNLVNQANYAITPNWIMHSVNLLPYVGTCITVEVVMSPCVCGGWDSYCYYDSECTDNFIETRDPIIPVSGNYVTCGSTASLSGTPGFSTYLWQGPANSGVSSLTTQAITTSVSGVYSLAVATGTTSYNQIISLGFGQMPTFTLSPGSPTVCIGGSVTLNASGSALTSYTWNTGANSTSVSVSPTVGTAYTALVTNASGCLALASISVQIVPSPQLVQITPGISTICPGTSITLSVSGNANTSYTWNTGSTSSSISVAPTASTVYSVSATNTLGCISSDTKVIGLYTILPLQISASSLTICANQTVSLTLTNPGITSYTWNTGLSNQPLSLMPAQTSTYTVVATDNNGCNSSLSVMVPVFPLPALLVTPTSPTICMGQVVNLNATTPPANTLVWNTGSTSSILTVTPQANNFYSVVASSPAGCTVAVSTPVTVLALPQVNITASQTDICIGETVLLNASSNGGNTTYLWSTGSNALSISVSPTSSMVYNVTVTDDNGCSSAAQKTVTVSTCTGIQDLKLSETTISIYPNPTSDAFTIKGSKNENGIIVNALGQQITTFSLSQENNYSMSFSGFAPGIYFLQTSSRSIKLIVK